MMYYSSLVRRAIEKRTVGVGYAWKNLVAVGHEKAPIWLRAIKIGAAHGCTWISLSLAGCSSAEPVSVSANDFITLLSWPRLDMANELRIE